MALYRVTFTFLDSVEGTTSRAYEGEFALNSAAVTAASDLQDAIVAISDSAVIKRELTEVTNITATPAANSRVFERVAAQVYLIGNKKYAINLPSPKAAIMSGNSLDPSAATWTAFTSKFVSGVGWTLSDGELLDASLGTNGTIGGKRVFVRSGSTNLPA